MANDKIPGKKRRLGEILLEAGVVDEPKLQAALTEQRRWGGKLGRTLVEMGFVDEDSMVRALSRQLGLTTVELDAAPIKPQVVQLLRIDHAERYGVFPLAGDARAKQLLIATADPTNQEAIRELEFATGYSIKLQVATASSIDRAIRRYYYGDEPTKTADPSNFGATETTFDPEALVADIPLGGEKPSAARAAPPVLTPAVSAPPAPAAPAPEPQPSSPVVAGTPVEAAPPPAPTASLHDLVKLQERVGALETAMAQQVTALHTLLEMLAGAGLVSRDEFFDRVQRSG